MESHARRCRSTSLTFFCIAKPFSNFDFIEKYFHGLHSLRRVFSQARQRNAKTLVFEKLDVSDAADLIEENEDIRVRYPAVNHSQAFRLSFFRSALQRKVDLEGLSENDCIGYAIVKIDAIPAGHPQSRIYESVFLGSEAPDCFVRRAPKWEVRVGRKSFQLHGYIYAQQNTVTNTCAHVAIRTAAAAFYPNGDMSYREMNSLTGTGHNQQQVDHVKRKAGGSDGEGLYPNEMVNILQAAGAACYKMEYVGDTSTLPPFEKYLYGSVESGYPAIVGFESGIRNGVKQHHAIPLFGHTFNEDTWVPKASRAYFNVGPAPPYVTSESWLAAYIGHDDNWGSNFCVPRNYLHTRPMCNRLKKGATPCLGDERHVVYVIGTFPKEVKVNSIAAELLGVDYLTHLLLQVPLSGNVWEKRLKAQSNSHLLVFRPLLVQWPEYIGHLRRIKDWDGRRIEKQIIDQMMRVKFNYVWLIELSVLELFSANRRKIGEVLIRADVQADTERNFTSFAIARLPSWFAILKGDARGGPEFRFIRSVVDGHVELFGCEETC